MDTGMTSLALVQRSRPFYSYKMLRLLTIMKNGSCQDTSWYPYFYITLITGPVWPWNLSLMVCTTDSFKVWGNWGFPLPVESALQFSSHWNAFLPQELFFSQPSDHHSWPADSSSLALRWPRSQFTPTLSAPLPLMSLPLPGLKPSRKEKMTMVSVCSALQFSSLNQFPLPLRRKWVRASTRPS